MQTILILIIKCYRYLLSPFIGQHCRFTPTCSEYAIEAIQLHGSIKGSWYALRRLTRCHPFCAGGVDPVPENKK
jgi:putative membrane protein insertion efficiency factor